MTIRPLLRTTVRIGLVACALVAGVMAYLVFQPGPTDFAEGHPVSLAIYQRPSPTGVTQELAGASILVRGKYLTDAADCQACHTVPGGTPFAGGRPFKLPFGTLFTPNITPDAGTGIGTWSDAQFVRAVHKGIAADGTRLYPAFPYASYSLMTDDDVLAIKAYLFSLKPVSRATIPNTLAFPFNQRGLMAVWATLFDADRRFRPIPEQSPAWNRGAYLVEAAAHCGECHTPRNLMQAMNTRQKFAGGAAEGWNAYNITSDRLSGVGAWSQAELVSYLSTGHATGRGMASGPMGEAVDLSLSKLSRTDIAAIATYLQTVPAIHNAKLPAPAPAADAAARSGPSDNPFGKHIFEGSCASCHAWSGAGAIIEEAQLTGNRAVNDASAVNVAMMVLHGAGSPGRGRPYMPSFADAYTDREVAAVANYVTSRFGAKTSRIKPEQVGKLRGM